MHILLYFIFCSLYLIFLIILFYVYFPCVVFYNICTVHGADLTHISLLVIYSLELVIYSLELVIYSQSCLAERISGSALPSLQDIYLKRCKSRAAKIIKDSNHPGNRLFISLPSGKRFRSVLAKLRDWGELLPSGHKAPKLSLISSIGLI